LTILTIQFNYFYFFHLKYEDGKGSFKKKNEDTPSIENSQSPNIDSSRSKKDIEKSPTSNDVFLNKSQLISTPEKKSVLIFCSCFLDVFYYLLFSLVLV
jgi:hypothetical protein